MANAKPGIIVFINFFFNALQKGASVIQRAHMTQGLSRKSMVLSNGDLPHSHLPKLFCSQTLWSLTTKRRSPQTRLLIPN